MNEQKPVYHEDYDFLLILTDKHRDRLAAYLSVSEKWGDQIDQDLEQMLQPMQEEGEFVDRKHVYLSEDEVKSLALGILEDWLDEYVEENEEFPSNLDLVSALYKLVPKTVIKWMEESEDYWNEVERRQDEEEVRRDALQGTM